MTSGISIFTNDKTITLLSYVPKKQNNVILVSSHHHKDKINPTTGKPDMIDNYSNNKEGVDALKKICAAYNFTRNTQRWPME